MLVTNAAYRLRASLSLEAMSITKGENIDKVSGARFLKRAHTELQKAKNAKSLGTKDNRTLWSFIDSYGDPTFLIAEGRSPEGNPVGALLTANRGKVDTVFVDPNFRGQGLGTALYLGAIHVLGSIRSSTYIGTLAVATWKAVSKYHQVKLERLTNKRPVEVQYNWGKDGIPVVDGTPINKMKDSFIFRASK